MNHTQRPPLPHATVATVVERDQRYLLVVENSGGQRVYNQPAGHLEANETLQQAALRETFEESGWHVKLRHFLGVSQFRAANGVCYLRHSFAASACHFDPRATRDPDILDTQWLSYEDIQAHRDKLRSPLVLHDIERYRRGMFYGLDALCGFITA